MGEVYFVKGGSHIKVGYSGNVWKRVSSLKTSSPVKLKLIGTIPGTRETEKAVHQQLVAYWSHREWFIDHPDVRKIIADLIAANPAPESVASVKPPRKRTERIPYIPPPERWNTKVISDVKDVVIRYHDAATHMPRRALGYLIKIGNDALFRLEPVIGNHDEVCPDWAKEIAPDLNKKILRLVIGLERKKLMRATPWPEPNQIVSA